MNGEMTSTRKLAEWELELRTHKNAIARSTGNTPDKIFVVIGQAPASKKLATMAAELEELACALRDSQAKGEEVKWHADAIMTLAADIILAASN